MSQLKTPSLRQRFLVAPVLGLVLLSLLTAVFTYELHRQNTLLTRVVEKDLVAFERYADIVIDLSEQHVGLFDLLNSAPQSDEEMLYDNAKQHLFAIHDATRKLREAVSTAGRGDARAMAQRSETLALIETYRRAAIAAVEMTTLNLALAPSQITLANQRFGAMNRAFEKLLNAELEEIKQHVNARVELNHARTVLAALGGIAFAVLLLALSVGLSRLLSRSLEEQIHLLGELGDPAQADTKAGGGDEVERMGRGIAAFRRTQLELRESEKHFRAAFDQAGVGMALRDIDPRNARFLRVNQKFADILGYTREELLQLTPLDLAPPEERDFTIENSEKLAKGEVTSHSRERRYVRKDGRLIWANTTLTAVSGPDGGLSHVMSVIEDITGRKEAEDKVARLGRIRAVMSEINTAIVRIRDRQSLFDDACRIAAEHGKFTAAWIGALDRAAQELHPAAWTGLDAELLASLRQPVCDDCSKARGTIGQALRTRQPAWANDFDADPDVGYTRRQMIERGYHSAISLPLLVDGELDSVFVLYARERDFFTDEEVAMLSELAADVSFALQSISKQQKLDHLSYYDTLTGLPNRTLFVDRAGQQMRSRGGEPMMTALILLNLERFRNINDTFGRHGGDELLKLVAQRLESAFSGKDYLARVGADGFGVVMRGIRDAAAVVHAVEHQILSCFQEPFIVGGSELRMAAKAGIALFPADGADADTLFNNAETALKKARGTGEHYLFYAADMNARAAQMLSLETRLRKAVEAQQFVLHYQPKIDLSNDAISGVEALIRWQDPETGLVPPGTFIPLLEETGLILEVGKWALAQAMKDHREWAARGCIVPRIAVNVSAIQLQQKDFTEKVIEVVQQGGGMPEALELEITESLLMKDIEASIRKLSILRGLGIHIAMDDFGTGYSSLSYIARLPLNSLKIDRSFITGMAASPQDMGIVTTIIALAHSLNLKVVAEGIETREQSQLLKLLRCEEAQGYLYSRPLPVEELTGLLAKRNAVRRAPAVQAA